MLINEKIMVTGGAGFIGHHLVSELLKYDILSNLENYFSIGRVIYLGIYSEEQRKEQNQLVIRLTLQLLDESLDIFDIEAKVG